MGKNEANSIQIRKPERKVNLMLWIENLLETLQWNVHTNVSKILSFWEKVKYVLSLDKVIEILYRPTDAASLGVVRALFGLCMVLDVVEERGFADVDIKWGDPHKCHFPLVHSMQPPSLPWMIVLYSVMWTGAFGIMLGFYFKIACACFIFPYWFLVFLDKSYWNNHTYLYGIVSILFWGTDANKYFSLDAMKSKTQDETVPFWNYFALKFQFFTLYFLAGLKKSSKEWLDGYAMTNLSNHWVFSPFKVFLTTEQTDLFVVHWFGFFFDLTVAFWMLFEKTRFPAMIFCTAFHFMNSRLFSIGMFPYVCLSTMFLFCEDDWPKTVIRWINTNIFHLSKDKNSSDILKNDKISSKKSEILKDYYPSKTKKLISKTVKKKEVSQEKTPQTLKRGEIKKSQIFVTIALFCHMVIQMFLPYSHFITKGYNNWVPGLYGYSWDMMVHAWDTILVVVKVHDNENDIDYFIDPEAWIQNDRWYKHGVMLKQYAHCLEKNLLLAKQEMEKQNSLLTKKYQKFRNLSSNISIYIDVWSSLNGRFQQRMFRPNVDLLKADWSVFQPVPYLMPLLSDLTYYRSKLREIQRKVYTWSNYTDVIFIADFPDMFLENYIHADLSNVSLTVLEGSVMYVEEDRKEKRFLMKGFSTSVSTETFHQIHVTSSYPACYMYTYCNSTKEQLSRYGKSIETKVREDTLQLIKEIKYRINAWTGTLNRIVDAFFYFVYNVPIMRRLRVN